jgi:multidrug resistance efflux pump
MAQVVVHDTTQRPVPPAPAGEPRAPALDLVRGAELETRLACAALELVAGVAEASTIDRAAVGIANRLKDFLAADGVALGLVRRNGRCRLAAISGASQINRGSELSRTIEDLLAGAVEHHSIHSQTHNDSLTRVLPGAAVVCRPLAAQRGWIAGALLVWGSGPQFDRSVSERFLRLVAEPIAGALLLQDRARAGLLRRALPGVLGKRRYLLWTALVAIGVVMMCLMPYRVTCDCAAEPSARRFVSAPFTGVFERSLVRPGDVVEKDALLGQMDGRELRIELAALTANYEQARKSRDVNLAAGKVAQAQIDRLELERLDQQRALVEHRMANLAIKSPVAGYVIGGDLKRTEGAPLTVGQVLYEIAPLEQMIVEVAIGDDDVALIDAGQRVNIRFDAYAGEEFAGRIVRIHPRSETRDSRNVFIGEVVLDEAGAALRPGMKGKARIVIADKSLAQGLAERVWHTVAMFLGF